jgi:hypothetical protein
MNFNKGLSLRETADTVSQASAPAPRQTPTGTNSPAAPTTARAYTTIGHGITVLVSSGLSRKTPLDLMVGLTNMLTRSTAQLTTPTPEGSSGRRFRGLLAVLRIRSPVQPESQSLQNPFGGQQWPIGQGTLRRVLTMQTRHRMLNPKPFRTILPRRPKRSVRRVNQSSQAGTPQRRPRDLNGEEPLVVGPVILTVHITIRTLTKACTQI